MAVPTKDSLLVSYSENFSDRITATPSAFGLTAGQATALAALQGAYGDAYSAMMLARDSGNRSKSLVTAKDDAKKSMLDLLRQLYSFVQKNAAVTDTNKDLLGVKVPKTEPSPAPPPSAVPGAQVVSVSGCRAVVRFSDLNNPERRGLPEGCIGLNVFTHVGETAPTVASGWTFQGGTGKLETTIDFGSEVAAGTKVWITGFFFNRRKVSSVSATPVSTNLQGGPALPMAA